MGASLSSNPTGTGEISSVECHFCLEQPEVLAKAGGRKINLMNRRTFSTLSLAAAFVPLARLPMAQPAASDRVGFQFAAINNGLLTVRHGGMARVGVAVDDDTRFQVASCSKTVTSLAVLTLVRDGHLALDAAANQYLRRWRLPGLRGDTVTIAELMSHTAGTSIHGFAGYGPSEDLPDLFEILSGRAPANSGAVRAQPRLFGKFRYSGGGTMVLQALIEDVTGDAFSTYTSRAVLRPIGASRATYAIAPQVDIAHGTYESGQRVEGGFRRHPESAAAGLWATASDLARILQAVLDSLRRKRRAILPFELATRMITPVSHQSGLGVFVEPDRVIWHEGRNYGFDAIMAAELATGRVRAAVVNRNGAIERYAQGLLPQ
ncbi:MULTISPECIES: serine hydrolase [unclassified Roseovarius]|uniref:serine hydrolase domain-containing protein n=1 Tax=unclassified Roseovarius TaxID=2614913 RepID=UPI00273DEB56|nr:MULTISPECIES: serine hydrolase domain-containing protein [unclassified Roseovarius]